MAPEILMEKGYGKEVDWWSIGVIMYECLVGYAPFSCEDTTETCMMILDWKNTLEFPKDARLSPEAIDLMKHLICDAKERYGFEQIVAHPFFKVIIRWVISSLFIIFDLSSRCSLWSLSRF
jgi:serine/threonine protein kinase